MTYAVPTTTARTPIQHALEQWSGHCRRFSPGTQSNYAAALARFVAFSRPACLADLTLAQFNAYINSRLSHRKPQTLNNDINAIRSFCRWMADNYDLPNPALKLRKMPVVDEQARFLTPDEYAKILAVAEGRSLALVKFLAHTGLRANELCRLTPASLNGRWLTVHGKGRKRRVIPLNQTALDTVKTAISFSKNRDALYYLCRRLAQKAGIPLFGPHALRHYCATSLFAAGAPAVKISRLLGHSSVAFTERIYYHFQPDHLSGLTDCLDAGEK